MSEYRRTVGLDKNHKDWIEENAINFSKWVRQKIDDELEADNAEA